MRRLFFCEDVKKQCKVKINISTLFSKLTEENISLLQHFTTKVLRSG